MLDRLASLETRYNELDRLLEDPDTLADYEKIAEYSKERSGMIETVEASRQYQRDLAELDDARAMLDAESDADMRVMAQDEIARLSNSIDSLQERLKVMLLPKDPRDDKNVIVEIRAGAGGDEAGLFAADLFRMYSYYAEGRRWKVEVIDQSETGIGGFKELKFEVRGQSAFSRMKYESGVHRVQRVPETESQGRVHTSTVTVAVLAQMDEVDVQLDMSEIRIDVFRAGGAGGQNVQKNETAVRMTHIPSGLVVAVQDERSQLQNRERAKTIMMSRLYEMEFEKQKSAQESERRSQVGTGERSEKIRTYNFKENRVTDHRINLTIYNLTAVLNGDLDPFIDELIATDQAEKLSGGASDDE